MDYTLFSSICIVSITDDVSDTTQANQQHHSDVNFRKGWSKYSNAFSPQTLLWMLRLLFCICNGRQIIWCFLAAQFKEGHKSKMKKCKICLKEYSVLLPSLTTLSQFYKNNW